ncbi:hypothetical protein ACW7G0_11845 [Lysobacter sp. A286]
MSRFDHLPDRALDLASQVGDRIRHAIPTTAKQLRNGGLLEAGVALGALKTGGRVATTFIRRNPAVAVAAAAGAGLLWYAARRRARQAENAAIEGKATRVETRRVKRPARKTPVRKRSAAATTARSD